MNPNSLRRVHGSCYISTLPDGLVVPWKLLSVGDREKYQEALNNPLLNKAVIEDEIFQKCVLDKTTRENIHKQKAGTIQVVVEGIWHFSGPQNIEAFNADLDFSRNKLETSLIHKMAIWILAAFPAYTMEQVEAMTHDDFMLRLAEAEYKLKLMGVEVDLDLVETNSRTRRPPRRPRPTPQRPQPQKPEPEKYEQTIIKTSDIIEHRSILTGADLMHDVHDRDKQLYESAKAVYPEYFDQIKKGEKVQIKSHEQRVAEANQRAFKSQMKNG